jgi:hypothetical protein
MSYSDLQIQHHPHFSLKRKQLHTTHAIKRHQRLRKEVRPSEERDCGAWVNQSFFGRLRPRMRHNTAIFHPNQFVSTGNGFFFIPFTVSKKHGSKLMSRLDTLVACIPISIAGTLAGLLLAGWHGNRKVGSLAFPCVARWLNSGSCRSTQGPILLDSGGIHLIQPVHLCVHQGFWLHVYKMRVEQA